MENIFNYTDNQSRILEESKILIIEDDRVNLMVLRDAFEKYGFKSIIEAKDGQEGLRKTKELHPDLVLLDIEMPIMNGYQYCEAVRQDPDIKHTTILVQTKLDDLKNKRKIFEVGATDHLTKPVDLYEIGAKSLVHLERNFLIKDLNEYRCRIREELESAKNLQNVLMSNEEQIEQILKRYNINVYSYFKTSSEIGGDFWGFREIDDDRLAIFNVDFSGHGINAALNTFRLHTLLHCLHQSNSTDPGIYMTSLNRDLATLLPAEQFATMFYGVIDLKNDILSYSVAASTSPIVFHDNHTSPYTIISGTGYPLGAVKSAIYKTSVMPFKEKDQILLYSDALIETPRDNGTLLGDEGLIEMAAACFAQGKHKTYEESFNSFLNEVKSQFIKNLKDDLTISMYCRK